MEAKFFKWNKQEVWYSSIWIVQLIGLAIIIKKLAPLLPTIISSNEFTDLTSSFFGFLVVAVTIVLLAHVYYDLIEWLMNLVVARSFFPKKTREELAEFKLSIPISKQDILNFENRYQRKKLIEYGGQLEHDATFAYRVITTLLNDKKTWNETDGRKPNRK